MKIVLLKDVPKLGRKYEIKEVKPGYGRNFLLARGLASLATKSALAQAEIKRRELETAIIKKREHLAKEVTELAKTTVQLTKRANDLGHLFEGLNNHDLATALRAQTNFDLEPDWIILDRPIKNTGAHTILVEHGEIKTSFQLIIEPEEGEIKIEVKKVSPIKKRSRPSPAVA